MSTVPRNKVRVEKIVSESVRVSLPEAGERLQDLVQKLRTDFTQS